MIAIVSTKTLRAREPDHSESRNPTESRSKRGPLRTSPTVGSRVSLMTLSVRKRAAYSLIELMTILHVLLADGVPDVAEAADEPEDQRREGEQREEARLRGQPGDAVAQAHPDRRDDEPGQRQEPRHLRQQSPQAPLRVGHGAHGNRRTLGWCGPTS